MCCIPTQAPTWIRNELKKGLVIRAREDGESEEEDSGSDSEEADSETEGTDTGIESDKSKRESTSRKPASSLSPDTESTQIIDKKDRFKNSKKSLSETRIVGGVAIATSVSNDIPLSVTSSPLSVRSESELTKANGGRKVSVCV